MAGTSDVTVDQLSNALDNQSYYFRKLTAPLNSKNGQKFTFKRRLFSDSSLQTKIGVMDGIATVYHQKNKKLIAMDGQLSLINAEIGPLLIGFNGSTPLMPASGMFWYMTTIASAGPSFSTCRVGSAAMILINNNVVKAQLHAGAFGYQS